MSVALLGTGLIGGSIGLALTKAGVPVRGYDATPTSPRARSSSARSTRSRPRSVDAVAGADVVIVAVPVGQVADARGRRRSTPARPPSPTSAR